MPDKANGNRNKLIFLLTSSFLLYIINAYLIQRTSHFALFSSFTFLFLLYLFTIKIVNSDKLIRFAIIGSIVIRLCLIFSIPNLSDDFYRFIWDGRLISSGENPFSHTPSYYIANPEENPIGYDLELYKEVNSQNYFTVYPPVLQFIFWISTYFSASIFTSVVIMRLFIIAAEVGTLLVMQSILKKNQLPLINILYYALNPLVILELTVNLHFEAIMIFFLMASIWYLGQNKIIWSSLTFGLAISSKLIPLIFIPLLIKRIGFYKFVWFVLIATVFCFILYSPLISIELINGMRSSISLYFQKFEFNASLYYILREIGYLVKGYNIIQTLGPYLAVVAFLSIIFYSIIEYRSRVNIATAMMFSYCIYILWATTVHPWYITPVVALSVFGTFRFSVVWSFLVFLTYAGYGQNGYNENLRIVAIEYSFALGFLFWEILKIRKMQIPLKA